MGKKFENAPTLTVQLQITFAAYERLCKLEGIFPSLEAAHALAILDKLVPTLCNGSKVVVNCSGRGDKDAAIVFNHKLFDGEC